VAAIVAATAAGCGLGAGPAPGGVQLTVTHDFGARVLSRTSAPKVKGAETVMSLLLRNDKLVTTRYGGGFVESIDGQSGGQEVAGDPVDWFYYVNGIEAPKGAATTTASTCTSQRGSRVERDAPATLKASSSKAAMIIIRPSRTPNGTTKIGFSSVATSRASSAATTTRRKVRAPTISCHAGCTGGLATLEVFMRQR